MPKTRCSHVKKGKRACRNPTLEGFNFCKSHLYNIDSLFKCRVPDQILLESSNNRQGFIFDSQLGHIYYLNATGLYILSMMKENKSISGIVKNISKRYRVNLEEALSDFRDFYNHLKDLGLVVSV